MLVRYLLYFMVLVFSVYIMVMVMFWLIEVMVNVINVIGSD